MIFSFMKKKSGNKNIKPKSKHNTMEELQEIHDINTKIQFINTELSRLQHLPKSDTETTEKIKKSIDDLSSKVETLIEERSSLIQNL